MEKCSVQDIKQLLGAHLGYLPFLKGMAQQCNKSDVEFLYRVLKEKHIIKLLPKQIMQYKDYYSLIFDLYQAESAWQFEQKLKSIPSKSRKYIRQAIQKEDNKQILQRIMSNEDDMNTFSRWSSRVQSLQMAESYLKGFRNKDCQRFLENNMVLRLTDSTRNLCPSSWCLHQDYHWQSYHNSYDMYLVLYDGKIHGVNLHKGDNGLLHSIIDSDNRTLDYLEEDKYIQSILTMIRQRYPAKYINGVDFDGKIWQEPQPIRVKYSGPVRNGDIYVPVRNENEDHLIGVRVDGAGNQYGQRSFIGRFIDKTVNWAFNNDVVLTIMILIGVSLCFSLVFVGIRGLLFS